MHKGEERTPLFHLTKADFDIQTFRSGGPGGQHQNKTETGVRIIHKASGIGAESRSERSQYQNRQIAFRRLCADPKFVQWLKLASSGQADIIAQAEAWADQEMAIPGNLQIQVKQDGEWVDWEDK